MTLRGVVGIETLKQCTLHIEMKIITVPSSTKSRLRGPFFHASSIIRLMAFILSSSATFYRWQLKPEYFSESWNTILGYVVTIILVTKTERARVAILETRCIQLIVTLGSCCFMKTTVMLRPSTTSHKWGCGKIIYAFIPSGHFSAKPRLSSPCRLFSVRHPPRKISKRGK